MGALGFGNNDEQWLYLVASAQLRLIKNYSKDIEGLRNGCGRKNWPQMAKGSVVKPMLGPHKAVGNG